MQLTSTMTASGMSVTKNIDLSLQKNAFFWSTMYPAQAAVAVLEETSSGSVPHFM